MRTSANSSVIRQSIPETAAAAKTQELIHLTESDISIDNSHQVLPSDTFQKDSLIEDIKLELQEFTQLKQRDPNSTGSFRPLLSNQKQDHHGFNYYLKKSMEETTTKK